MTTGATAPTTPVSESVQASIKGLITLDDPDVILSRPTSVDGLGENPLIQVKMSLGANVEVYGKTSEDEAATGVYVREIGSEAVYYPLLPDQILSVPISAGVSDIWFVYPSFGQDEPSIPPYYGGGMG
jgi:hypothetical protein